MGIGLVAAVTGPGAVPVFITAIIGYLLRGGVGLLRYMAALIAVVGLRWSVAGFPKISRSPVFAPVIALLGTLVTGSALLITDTRSLADVLSIVSESLLSAGFAYFASSFLNVLLSDDPMRKSGYVQAGSIVVVSVMMMALFSIELEGISVGRILAVLCILTVSHCCGVKGGTVCGSIFGLTVLLSQPEQMLWAPVYAFGGLMAGLFSHKGRLVSAAAFLAVNGIVYSVLQTEVEVSLIIGLYEIGVATVFTFFVPESMERTIKQFLREKEQEEQSLPLYDAMAAKMGQAAETMELIGGTVDRISKQMSSVSAPEIGSFYRMVTEKTCKNCKRKLTCWESNFSDAMDSFNHFTPILNRNETVTPEHAQGYLRENCICLADICTGINTGYPEHLVRQSAFGRLQELRGILTDQFTNTAQILREFSEQFSVPVWENTEIEDHLRTQLEKENILFSSVTCRICKGGRMEVEISMNAVFALDEIQDLCEDIGRWCDRTLSVVSIQETGEMTHLVLSEGISFRVSVGAAQSRCKGEKLCGDAYETFWDLSGNFFAVMSDGMGCGGRAAVDGAMTAGLTSQLIRAGFGYESILRMANTALMAKSNDETLATLDIASINLYTGELEVLKAGAGPSLLLSHGLISRFEESSLPLGILRELTFARTRDRLVDGDLLLLMSDGVSNDGIHWVEELLRDFDVEKGDIQTLADTIVETARRLCQSEKGDDITAIVIKIDRIL